MPQELAQRFQVDPSVDHHAGGRVPGLVKSDRLERDLGRAALQERSDGRRPATFTSNNSEMDDFPLRSQQLIDAVPLKKVQTGVRSVIEVTAYPDGHANIAVGELDTSQRGAMRYARTDSLPLNDRRELERFVKVIIDRLFGAAKEG